MITLFICLLLPVAVAIALVRVFRQRALEMRELCDQGMAATAIVVSKRFVRNNPGQSRQRKITYEYRDQSGTLHRHTSLVPIDVYQACEEGATIDVVYSAHRPQVSAPLYLVEHCRRALGRKRG